MPNNPDQDQRLVQPTAPVKQLVYPTMGSLQEVIDLGMSKLPITDANELHSLLMTYHNTLLDQVASCQ